MKNRGIVLITSIVLVVVMVMFLGAALALGPTNLAAGQSTLYQGQAQRAAESGIQYALSQLRQDPTWVGARNQITVNTPEMFVQEDNGNVVGLMRQPDGSWSQFRLRFNAQDGPGGVDAMDNPAALTFDHPYVSVNNLVGGVTAPVLRGDGPGFSVTAASKVACQAPVWSACLSAEGKAGPACNQLSPANPNPGNLGGASRAAVEGIFQIPDMGPTVQEAGSMSARDFLVGLRANTGVVSVTSNTDNTPRLRSRGEVKVDAGGTAGSYVSPDGEVRINPGASNPTLQASYTAVPAPTGVSVVAEDMTSPFYQLAWNDVKKAAPSGAKLSAGTYVWWDNGSGASLHYYDMDYETYTAWIQDPANANNPGVSPPSLPPEVVLDAANKKLTVQGNVYVDPTGHSTNELNILPRLGGAQAPPGDPEATSGGGGSGIDPVDLATNFTAYGGSRDYVATPSGWASMANDTSGNGADILAFLRGSGQPADGTIKLLDANGVTITGFTWSDLTQTTGTVNMMPGAALFNFWLNPAAYAPGSMSLVGSAGTITGTGTVGGGPLDPNNGEIAPPGVTDTLSAADLSLDFAPPPGTPATLTCDGNVRLTSAVGGLDGSITAGGDIRITGMGAQFAANQSVGVNMYAGGDIIFSTLDNNNGVYTYRDVNLKGVIYAQGDFVARLGSPNLPGAWGNVNLDGCLIAYGGDPAGAPGTRPNKGKIDLRAENVNLRFDATYMGGLTATPPVDFKVQCISWTNRT